MRFVFFSNLVRAQQQQRILLTIILVMYRNHHDILFFKVVHAWGAAVNHFSA
jgi:hypothetical protein